ncbi:unnamed protein product [Aureobasidium vineae]|uniref:Multicopper oxidase n=1 Tax=Aureobasidium vineae TaxID=2773715 RepID=A0A9N8JR31_9PEZI|nr:unnamed protein product [Aureobasidium vineae]
MLGNHRVLGHVRARVQSVCLVLLVFVVSTSLTARFYGNLDLPSSFKTTSSGSYKPSTLPPSTSSSSTSSSSTIARLNIQLRPEDHITREPTTLSFKWRVTSVLQYPDGVEKLVFLINGQFPGPTIEARSGDRLVIELENGLKTSHTAIHWHGIQMEDANAMDGAVGVTQSAIKPGEMFIYNFTISSSEHGTFWYHAHDQVQRADGLYGGLIVHKPFQQDSRRGSASSIATEQLLMVSDWYHRSATDVLSKYMSPGSFGHEPVPDSLLLNGRGSYNCSMVVPARPVVCTSIERPTISLPPIGRTKLRVINVGSFAGVEVKLPDFDMALVEIDGGNAVTTANLAKVNKVIWPGQRADLDISPSSTALNTPHISIELSHENFKYSNPALATVHNFSITYQEPPLRKPCGKHRVAQESRGTWVDKPIPMALEADKTIVLYSTTLKLSHLANIPHGFVNHTSWAPQDPPLISVDRTLWNDNQLVAHIPYNDSHPLWVDIVLNNLDEDSHSWHLHGHSFYVIASHTASFGWGSYNPYVDTELPGGALDLTDPPMRDTVYVPRRGYVILRFRAGNPGIWMLHCHMLWHQASGMAMALQVGNGSL